MKRLAKVLLLCVFVGPCALCVGWNASRFPEKEAREAENRARAEQIVAAVWAFHRETGAFPENLASLASGHLEDVAGLRESASNLRYDATEAGFSIEYLEAPLGAMHGDGFHRYVSRTDSWDFYFP